MSDQPILQAKSLKKFFPVRGGFFSSVKAYLRAVDDVTFDLYEGETLGIVGESGCGKSTLGKTLIRLEDATDGEALYRGEDIFAAKGDRLMALRRQIQMIFQDPYSSLNPRMTIGEIIAEPFEIHGIGNRDERAKHVSDLLETVGLSPDVINRYPHEFSGGQRQRIGIARALALKPEIIIADEPVSALDVSVQAQVLNLLVKLQKEFKLTYIFISHDLKVVEFISDRVAIMYLGKVVEEGPRETIFARPTHPYTRALLDSTPIRHPDQKKAIEPIKGEIPSAVNPPRGCPFHPRCPYAVDNCKKLVPYLQPHAGVESHRVSCHLKDTLPAYQRTGVATD